MMTIDSTFQNILPSRDVLDSSNLVNLDVTSQDSAIMNFIENIQRNSNNSDQNCYLNDIDSMLS